MSKGYMLLACRGDRALAKHLFLLGYRITRNQVSPFQRIHSVLTKGGETLARLERIGNARFLYSGPTAIPTNVYKGPTLYSMVGTVSGLVGMDPKEYPMLLCRDWGANRITCGRYVLHAWGFRTLIQDLLEYKTR